MTESKNGSDTESKVNFDRETENENKYCKEEARKERGLLTKEQPYKYNYNYEYDEYWGNWSKFSA